MTGTEIGVACGVLGVVVGLSGGVLGLWATIKNSQTEAQRRLVVQMAALVWMSMPIVAIIVSLEMRGLLPHWIRWLFLLLFFAALGPSIILANRRYNRLGEESRGIRSVETSEPSR